MASARRLPPFRFSLLAGLRRDETGSCFANAKLWLRGAPAAQAGYTLIELLVVLAIISLLMAALPLLVSGGRARADAKAAAYTIASELRSARAEAIGEDRVVKVVFDAGQGTYRVDGEFAVRKLAPGVLLAFGPVGSEQTEGTPRILFYPDGSTSGGEVFLDSEERRFRIVVHALSGRVFIDEERR